MLPSLLPRNGFAASKALAALLLEALVPGALVAPRNARRTAVVSVMSIIAAAAFALPGRTALPRAASSADLPPEGVAEDPKQGGSSKGAPASDTVLVVLETEAGDITLEIDRGRAPITAANFLRYVDGGFYDGGQFHRVVRPDNEVRADAPIQVVQARIDQARRAEAFPPVALERTSRTGLRHLDGTISMARDVTAERPGPDTVRSDFFMCVGDQPSLDSGGRRSPDGQGFSAFGRVVAGRDVVRRIHGSPAPPGTPARFGVGEGQTLEPMIRIIRAYRK